MAFIFHIGAKCTDLFTCYYYFIVSTSATVLGPKHIGRERIIYIFYIHLNDWQRGHKITLVFCLPCVMTFTMITVLFTPLWELRDLWHACFPDKTIKVKTGHAFGNPACTLWWVATSCHLS